MSDTTQCAISVDHSGRKATVFRAFASRPCPRPVQAEGLCAVHLAAKQRKEAAQAKRNAEWADGKRVQARMEALVVHVGCAVWVDSTGTTVTLSVADFETLMSASRHS